MEAEAGAGVDLVQELGALVEIAVDGGERRDDGGGPEPVGDGGEVGEVSLDAGLQDGRLADVAQRTPVLVQQLTQLPTHHPEQNIYYI